MLQLACEEAKNANHKTTVKSANKDLRKQNREGGINLPDREGWSEPNWERDRGGGERSGMERGRAAAQD